VTVNHSIFDATCEIDKPSLITANTTWYPLLGHAQLPPGSAKDQPKQLSSSSRNTVRHHPKQKRHASAEVTQNVSAAGRIPSCDTGFRRACKPS